jgi:hypothetical protein
MSLGDHHPMSINKHQQTCFETTQILFWTYGVEGSEDEFPYRSMVLLCIATLEEPSEQSEFELVSPFPIKTNGREHHPLPSLVPPRHREWLIHPTEISHSSSVDNPLP